jgi:DNA-binding NarL/FixJ family response regulator
MNWSDDVFSFGAALIVDPNAEGRREIAAALSRVGIQSVEAELAAEALELAARALPGAVLLEVSLPDLSGYQVCRELREAHGPELPIVFMSADRTAPGDRVAGLLIGADDYVDKPLDPNELSIRVRKLMLRGRRTPPRRQRSLLTPRELEVVRLLAAGYDQARIARELVISPRTVSTHIERVLVKAGVRSRAQAVSWAYRTGLVEL